MFIWRTSSSQDESIDWESLTTAVTNVAQLSHVSDDIRTRKWWWIKHARSYHTTGLKVSGLLREQGIPCSLYIDDRLNGELLTKSGPWSILYSDRRKQCRVKAVRAAIFIVFSVLVELGYTTGISKSVLYPTTSLQYLGFLVDSEKESFIIPQCKIVAWASLREKILACKNSMDVKSLQRF